MPHETGRALSSAHNHPKRGDTVIDCESGPHVTLAASVVKLALRDLHDPHHSVEARAYLRGEPFQGRPVGIAPDLLAEVLGYEGDWENG